MIFAGQSRDQLRETYRAAWRRFKQQHTLSPLDKQVVAVISEHPEYHVIVESAAADLANYSPRSGQLNPWLHMGLHLAIREQVATNRPRGHRRGPREAARSMPAARTKPNTACSKCWPSSSGKRNAAARRRTKTPISSACGASPDGFALPAPDADAFLLAPSEASRARIRDPKCEPVPTPESPRAAARKAADYTRRELV